MKLGDNINVHEIMKLGDNINVHEIMKLGDNKLMFMKS